MAAVFEVGKSYEANDPGYNPITVLRRTDKTIWVDNDQSKWRMRISHDADGNEMVTDSSVPYRWRDALTYKASWVIEEERTEKRSYQMSNGLTPKMKLGTTQTMEWNKEENIMITDLSTLVCESKDGSYVHVGKVDNMFIVYYTEPKWQITSPQEAVETLEEVAGVVASLLSNYPNAGFQLTPCLTE